VAKKFEYQPDEIRILGHLDVPIKWEASRFKHGDGDECDGLFTSEGIRVWNSPKERIQILIHELWHAQTAEIGDDETTPTDNEARRVTNFIADLASNNWELLEALRAEKGRS
jgi:RecB family endonuclease NucS